MSKLKDFGKGVYEATGKIGSMMPGVEQISSAMVNRDKIRTSTGYMVGRAKQYGKQVIKKVVGSNKSADTKGRENFYKKNKETIDRINNLNKK